MLLSLLKWFGLALFAIIVYYVLYFVRLTLTYRQLKKPLESLPKLENLGAVPMLGIFKKDGLDQLFRSVVDSNGNVKDVLFAGAYLDGSPWVLISHPEDIKTVLSSEAEFAKLPLAYDTLAFLTGDGLVTSHGELWKRQRRLITPIFHFSNLRNMTPTIVSNTARWIQEMRDLNGASIEPFPHISRLAMRTIIDCAFGHGGLDPTLMHHHLGAAIRAFELYFLSSLLLGKKLTDSLPLPWSRKIHFHTEKVREMVQELISRRRRELEQLPDDAPEREHPSDLLTALLLAGDSEYEMSDKLIIDESVTFLFAGHDTTSNLLSWCLYFLARNPRVVEKLREEGLAILGDESEPGGIRAPTHDEIPQLKYHKHTLYEALRMRPPVPILDRVAMQDCEFQGLSIPKGTYIFPYFLAAHHDARYWNEPMEFRPERFETHAAPRGERRHAYSFTPFSAGPRNCVGQKFANLAATTMLLYIAQNFDLKADVNEKVLMQFQGTMTPNGFHVSLIPRKLH